jgi:hypothetical protein
MRNATTAAVLVGVLTAVLLMPGAAAGQSSSQTTPAASRATAAVPNHALSGVVKSVDATRLVITRAGKTHGEMTFVLSPATHREGPIGVGATVQVRFRTKGHTRVATAILATPPKHAGGKAP